MKNCVICLDKIKVKEKYKLVCNHIYHYNCISTWCVQYRNRFCPICKKRQCPIKIKKRAINK